MFNKTARTEFEKEINSEGYATYKDRIDRALYQCASSFKPRNSYYQSIPDRLMTLENLIDENFEKDPEFVMALTHFLGKEMGIKLSPTIMTTRMVLNSKLSDEDKKAINVLVDRIFTNPKFIANSLGYVKYFNGTKSFMTAPNYFLDFLREKAGTYKEHTWLKNRMIRREIKARDIIKALRVKPSPELEDLFRKIIQNRASMSVKIDEETGKVTKAMDVTSVLSDERVTKEAKVEFMKENISTMAINQLVRNLSQLESSDATEIENRLESIFSSGDGRRFINPFDLVLLEGRYINNLSVSTQIQKSLDRVLEQHIVFKADAKHPVILQDLSGSMYPGWNPHKLSNNKFYETGLWYSAKFLSLILPMLDNYDFWGFDIKWKNLTSDISPLVLGHGPNKIAQNSINFFKNLRGFSGGTSLLSAMRDINNRTPDCDLLIILSDEQTWFEGKEIDNFKNTIPDHLKGRTILINVAPCTNTAIRPDAEVVRLSGLDGKVFDYIELIVDFDKFKEKMISDFREVLTKY